MSTRILIGDVREQLATLPDQSVQCCVTSPPYYGLRDYGVPGQLGLEPTLAEYLATMVQVFRDVRRVLRDDGTLWLNIGDSYASSWPAPNTRRNIIDNPMTGGKRGPQRQSKLSGCLKEKDLMMVPARLAIALQDDGWYLRSDIIWAKPNPMPESVTDRPTSAHEHIFLLTKSARYFYDADAVREESITNDNRRPYTSNGAWNVDGRPVEQRHGGEQRTNGDPSGRNLRNVWTIATHPYAEAHFATFPPEIPRRCIKAGSRVSDTILDPFLGSGTTLLVADQLDRDGIGIELNPTYAELARNRIYNDAPLFADIA